MNLDPDKTAIEQMAPWFGEEERRAVAEYIDSGGWLTEFHKTSEFERMIAEYAGSRHAIVVTSGTAALFCALVGCGIGPGDEVIVPDFTMIATANAVLLAGARPVLGDIDPSNLCLDLNAAERAITQRTRAILLVSINGRTAEIAKTEALARKYSLKLIEDAAQSFGSVHCGRALGTFGLAGVYSFSPMKIISTGQGGAVVTDDPEVASRIRRFKDFGRTRGGIDEHESIGYNFKFTDLQAVIGIEQMKKLEWRVRRKKELFALYRSELGDVKNVTFVDTDLSQVTPWFIDVLADKRDALISHLKANRIGARPFYPPIHSQLPYQGYERCPVTEETVGRGVWLPSSSFLSDDDVRRVCDSIRSFYEAGRISRI
jgi:perosamine synthetase